MVHVLADCYFDHLDIKGICSFFFSRGASIEAC
jgi:hypothetical protein